MAIIANFSDYYDSVAHQLIDKDTMYVRQFCFARQSRKYPADPTAHPELKELFEFAETACRAPTRYHLSKPPVEEYVKDGVGMLLICGKLYPFAYSSHASSFGECAAAQMLDYIKDGNEGYDVDFSKPYRKIDTRVHRYLLSSSKLQQHATGSFNNRVVDWNHEIAPIILLLPNVVVLNPPLKHLHAPIHPYELAQELSMFLRSKTPTIPEMDDQTKTEASGFNELSFRKDKGGPTRKSKKNG